MHQRAIAGVVADLVVDALEVVQVDQRHAQAHAVAARGIEQAREAMHQPRAVGQPGQAVGAGHLDQPLHAIDDHRRDQRERREQHQPLQLPAEP